MNFIKTNTWPRSWLRSSDAPLTRPNQAYCRWLFIFWIKYWVLSVHVECRHLCLSNCLQCPEMRWVCQVQCQTRVGRLVSAEQNNKEENFFIALSHLQHLWSQCSADDGVNCLLETWVALNAAWQRNPTVSAENRKVKDFIESPACINNNGFGRRVNDHKTCPESKTTFVHWKIRS